MNGTVHIDELNPETRAKVVQQIGEASGRAALVPAETSVNTNILSGPVGVQFTKTGIAFHKELPTEEWIALGKKLKEVEGTVQWWIGDWLNYGEKTYGEKYTEALASTGYEYKSLANMKTVAGAIQFSLRRENLSWSHHKEVAGLEPETRERLLTWAEKGNASVSDLRAEIKGKTNQPALHPLEELQQQLSRLHAARCDGQENQFVQALERSRSADIDDIHAPLALIVANRLSLMAADFISTANSIKQNILKEKVA